MGTKYLMFEKSHVKMIEQICFYINYIEKISFENLNLLIEVLDELFGQVNIIINLTFTLKKKNKPLYKLKVFSKTENYIHSIIKYRFNHRLLVKKKNFPRHPKKKKNFSKPPKKKKKKKKK